MNIRPVNFFDLEFKQKYKEIADKFIARSYEAIAKLQFHRNFWFRAIFHITNLDIYATDEHDEGFNIYPLFTYKPSANTSIYLGATDSSSKGNEQVWDNSSQTLNNDFYDFKDLTYFLKISYTFDIM